MLTSCYSKIWSQFISIVGEFFKNKKMQKIKSKKEIYLICFMDFVWAADPTLDTDRPTLMAGLIP